MEWIRAKCNTKFGDKWTIFMATCSKLFVFTAPSAWHMGCSVHKTSITHVHCQSVITITAPASTMLCSSLTCCDTVQGMRSPDALFPRDKLCITDAFEISPSKQTLKYITDIIGNINTVNTFIFCAIRTVPSSHTHIRTHNSS